MRPATYHVVISYQTRTPRTYVRVRGTPGDALRDALSHWFVLSVGGEAVPARYSVRDEGGDVKMSGEVSTTRGMAPDARGRHTVSIPESELDRICPLSKKRRKALADAAGLHTCYEGCTHEPERFP